MAGKKPVAIVVGAAFTAVVQALVKDLITPMIGAVGAEVCSGSFGAALEAINQAATKQRGEATVDGRDVAAT